MKNLDFNKIKKKYDNQGFVVLKKFFKKKKKINKKSKIVLSTLRVKNILRNSKKKQLQFFCERQGGSS